MRARSQATYWSIVDGAGGAGGVAVCSQSTYWSNVDGLGGRR
ncbi:MAG TPA: hypothetical protein PLX71_10200 [Phycicoccus sp.]|nr:hypothetical protein [Phycicoccus sp.]